MKLPAFLEPFVFGAPLSGLMSFIVSGKASPNAVGLTSTRQSLEIWLFAWAVAFPTVLIITPMVRGVKRPLVAPTLATFAFK